MILISGSVGKGGRNIHNDVKAIQIALNNSKVLKTKIKEDGIYGINTYNSILHFQMSVFFQEKDWDGLISPNGNTLRALNNSKTPATRNINPVTVKIHINKLENQRLVSSVLDWETLKGDYVRWEGKVPYMYLDTKNLVTVGIGKMLPNVAAAQILPFVRRSDQKLATPIEIKTDFDNVKKQPGGMQFTKYKQFTTLELRDNDIFTLLKTVHDGFQQNLKDNFPSYETFPATVKRALIDMVYNLGINGLMKYSHLRKSIEVKNWKKAAAECHRNGPSEERNNWTRDMFLAAAK